MACGCSIKVAGRSAGGHGLPRKQPSTTISERVEAL